MGGDVLKRPLGNRLKGSDRANHRDAADKVLMAV
jgi:hypothetical protein